MTGGDVLLKGARPQHLQKALDVLEQTGAHVTVEPSGVRIRRNGNGIQPVDIETDPFPGFPTDLQAQFMALMTMSSGASRIRETIFENRYMHVAELARFGADIKVEGQVATVTGGSALTGAQVMATDLRASVSLVIAGLAARGETIVNRIYHLDRGFERLEEKLSGCGAEIERVAGRAARFPRRAVRGPTKILSTPLLPALFSSHPFAIAKSRRTIGGGRSGGPGVVPVQVHAVHGRSLILGTEPFPLLPCEEAARAGAPSHEVPG